MCSFLWSILCPTMRDMDRVVTCCICTLEALFVHAAAMQPTMPILIPVPEAYQPWEGKHSYVTFLSPCPEKGLSIFLRIAESLPDVQFLAVKTVAWTKPWHEQILKRLKNVKVQAASERLRTFLASQRLLGYVKGWRGVNCLNVMIT